VVKGVKAGQEAVARIKTILQAVALTLPGKIIIAVKVKKS